MTRNYRLTLAVTVALLGLTATGCTDPTVGPRSTVSETTVFDSPASYRAFLAKIYAGLALTGQRGGAGDGDIRTISDEGFSSYLRLYWQHQELPTDEVLLAWANDGPVLELNSTTWGAGNDFVSAMYARIFFQVGLVNVFLQQTTDSKLDERGVSGQLRNDIKTFRAEARFLRALSYWHGMDLFGGIPIVTEPSGTPPKASTRQEVFDFVVSELTAIQPDLLPAAGGATYARATQEAAQMLLAHVYLNAEVYTGTPKYVEAMAAADAVINSGKFSLNTNFFNNFKADNNTSPEIIFPVISDGSYSRGYGGTTFLVHAACFGDARNPGAGAWEQNPTAYGIDGCWWGLKVRPQAFNRLRGDPRESFWFTGRDTAMITTFAGSATEGAASTKWTNLTSTGAAGSNGTFPDTDYPMFRLADAYLIYAEAAVRSGTNLGTALNYVNTVRQRAYGNTSGDITGGQLTLDFLLDERGKELFFEGQRRTDLIRFGKFTGVTYNWLWKGGVLAGTDIPDYKAIYPIPSKQLAANPNLTQNTGY